MSSTNSEYCKWIHKLYSGSFQQKGAKVKTILSDGLFFGSPCWTRTSDTLTSSQVYFRKHSRLGRLGTLVVRYSLFSWPPVAKRATGTFCSVVYRLSSSVVSMAGRQGGDDLKSIDESQKKRPSFRMVFSLAPPAGLEPATPWLTVRFTSENIVVSDVSTLRLHSTSDTPCFRDLPSQNVPPAPFARSSTDEQLSREHGY